MKLSDAKARRDVLVVRELEIRAQLADMKRAYIVDKVESDFALRTTLESELANVSLEKHQMIRRVNQTRDALKAYRTTLSHAVLIRLVTDKGMGDLVVEADRMASDIALAEV